MAVVIVILGGTGRLLGPAAGAIVVVSIEHLLSSYVERWPLVLGLAFIVVVLFFPQGLVGSLSHRRGPADFLASEDLRQSLS